MALTTEEPGFISNEPPPRGASVMAVIANLPALDIISGFKGTLDFYLWKGIACVRSWPRSPTLERTQAVQAQWPAFAKASRLWSQLSPAVQAAYVETASGSSISGRDLFVKGYISGIYRYPH